MRIAFAQVSSSSCRGEDEHPPGRASARWTVSSQRNVNVDAHLRGVAAVRAREVPDEILAPDFRIENHAAAAIDHVYLGSSGWREWMSDLFEAFAERACFGVEELIAVGEDFVAATFFVVGSSVHSGESLEFRWTSITWFRDGKATRVIGHASRDAALKAVGLR